MIIISFLLASPSPTTLSSSPSPFQNRRKETQFTANTCQLENHLETPSSVPSIYLPRKALSAIFLLRWDGPWKDWPSVQSRPCCPSFRLSCCPPPRPSSEPIAATINSPSVSPKFNFYSQSSCTPLCHLPLLNHPKHTYKFKLDASSIFLLYYHHLRLLHARLIEIWHWRRVLILFIFVLPIFDH